jgi:hypothetical protein
MSTGEMLTPGHPPEPVTVGASMRLRIADLLIQQHDKRFSNMSGLAWGTGAPLRSRAPRCKVDGVRDEFAGQALHVRLPARQHALHRLQGPRP